MTRFPTRSETRAETTQSTGLNALLGFYSTLKVQQSQNETSGLREPGNPRNLVWFRTWGVGRGSVAGPWHCRARPCFPHTLSRSLAPRSESRGRVGTSLGPDHPGPVLNQSGFGDLPVQAPLGRDLLPSLWRSRSSLLLSSSVRSLASFIQVAHLPPLLALVSCVTWTRSPPGKLLGAGWCHYASQDPWQPRDVTTFKY